jgi:uncharacterized protein YcfL
MQRIDCTAKGLVLITLFKAIPCSSPEEQGKYNLKSNMNKLTNATVTSTVMTSAVQIQNVELNELEKKKSTLVRNDSKFPNDLSPTLCDRTQRVFYSGLL